MRIALLVTPYPMRAVVHATGLAREFLGRGHAVRGFGAPPGTIPRSASEPSVDGGVAPDEGLGLAGFQPDIIVAYGALTPAAWHGARRARKLGVSLVLVEDGFPPRGRSLERMLRRLGRRLWGGYVRRSAERLIALDGVAREQALRAGFPAQKVRVVPGGVDLVRHRPGLTSQIPARHGIRGRILLYIGPIEEGRGLDVLVDAFAATVGRSGHWSLVIAGEGAARTALRARADRLGVGAHAHWLPYPRPEEQAGLMGASTLFVVPTLGDHVPARKLCKALACGLPAIASDLPALADLIEPDGCGLLAKPGDVTSWVESIQAAVSSPTRRERWARRAREVAEQRFGWPIVAENFERELQEVLDHASDAKPAEGRTEPSPERS